MEHGKKKVFSTTKLSIYPCSIRVSSVAKKSFVPFGVFCGYSFLVAAMGRAGFSAVIKKNLIFWLRLCLAGPFVVQYFSFRERLRNKKG